MGIDQLRTDLIQRIEQADEKMLRVITSVVEAVESEYVSDDVTLWPDEAAEAMTQPGWAKPLTEEALGERLANATAEIERGEFITLQDLEKEVETW